MNIAVIPARGGSQRIPRKNIKDFCGKPMIAWSIQAAQHADIFDHIVVSTDDREIAAVAKSCGARVPFSRPDELSDAHAGTTAVIAHAVEWMNANNWSVKAVCCIYATAPFLQIGDLLNGHEVLRSGEWDYVFSATQFSSPVYRAFTEARNGGVEMLFPENFTKRSQDLPLVLHDAAQFYWGTPAAWVGQKPIFGKHSTPICIPSWRVQDIDEPDDWIAAEILYKQLEGRQLR